MQRKSKMIHRKDAGSTSRQARRRQAHRRQGRKVQRRAERQGPQSSVQFDAVGSTSASLRSLRLGGSLLPFPPGLRPTQQRAAGEEKLCRQRAQGSPGSRVCENAAPARRTPPERFHHTLRLRSGQGGKKRLESSRGKTRISTEGKQPRNQRKLCHKRAHGAQGRLRRRQGNARRGTEEEDRIRVPNRGGGRPRLP